MQILLAARASELHMSAEAPLYDVHILLQPCASMPDGPAEPVVLNAADLMVLASIESKITGWIDIYLIIKYLPWPLDHPY